MKPAENCDPDLITASTDTVLQKKEEKHTLKENARLHRHVSAPRCFLPCDAALYGSGCIMNLVIKCVRGLEGNALAEISQRQCSLF